MFKCLDFVVENPRNRGFSTDREGPRAGARAGARVVHTYGSDFIYTKNSARRRSGFYLHKLSGGTEIFMNVNLSTQTFGRDRLFHECEFSWVVIRPKIAIFKGWNWVHMVGNVFMNVKFLGGDTTENRDFQRVNEFTWYQKCLYVFHECEFSCVRVWQTFFGKIFLRVKFSELWKLR